MTAVKVTPPIHPFGMNVALWKQRIQDLNLGFPKELVQIIAEYVETIKILKGPKDPEPSKEVWDHLQAIVVTPWSRISRGWEVFITSYFPKTTLNELLQGKETIGSPKSGFVNRSYGGGYFVAMMIAPTIPSSYRAANIGEIIHFDNEITKEKGSTSQMIPVKATFCEKMEDGFLTASKLANGAWAIYKRIEAPKNVTQLAVIVFEGNKL